MSWLQELNQPGHRVYYAFVPVEEYYEWKHHNAIRSGVTFHDTRPPINKIAEEGIIVSVELPASSLEKTSKGFKLTQPTYSKINIEAGSLRSEDEILDKYQKMSSEFNREYKFFRDGIVSRIFILLAEDKGKLCRVMPEFTDNERVGLESYGAIDDILERIHKTARALYLKANEKVGRAFERTDYVKFSNLASFITRDIHTGGPKWQFLLDTAEIKPVSTYKKAWIEFFTDMSYNGSEMYNYIKRLESMDWVKNRFIK